MPEHVVALITYMEDSVPIDGMYKVAVLRTVAEYFSALTQAESVNAVLMQSFNNLN